MTELKTELSLPEKQWLFMQLLANLINFARSHEGWALRCGEAWRSPEEAERLEAAGLGSKLSLHKDRLAIDLCFDVNGVYQKDSEAYRPLGEFWEGQHVLARWGGRFTKKIAPNVTVPAPDGNHFSLHHHGRA